MYKIKIGLHIYQKKIVVNILVLLQLAVIIFALNTVLVYGNDTNHYTNITKQLLDSQFIKIPYFTEDLNEIVGENAVVHQSYIARSYINDVQSELRFIDMEILSKLKYKTRKGRWLKMEDKGTTNAVVSYTDKFKVGDTVKYSSNYKTIDIKIIGILKEDENLFSLSSSGNGFYSLFDKPQNCDVAFFLDVNENCNINNFASASFSFVDYPVHISAERYDSISQIIAAGNNGFSIQSLRDTMKVGNTKVTKLVLPICVFIAIISILAFWMISSISFKNFQKEFSILKCLGAKKGDLVGILTIYLLIPISIICAIFVPFGKILFLPINLTNKFTVFNYFLPIIISLLFALINFIMLFFKFFRKGGLQEVFNENR